MANNIYITPFTTALDLMNKSSDIVCLPLRTDCTPYKCDNLVRSLDEQWQVERHKLCRCAKPYFLMYPKGEKLTFQTQFPQNIFTSVRVTMKDCNDNDLELSFPALTFQYNENEIQNFEIDTSLIEQDLSNGWYLCYEFLDQNGEVLDCCFDRFLHAPFIPDTIDGCTTICRKGKKYVKLEGCNTYDCCGTVYGELSGVNVGRNIKHTPKMWVEGFAIKDTGSVTNEFYGNKSTKGTQQNLLNIQLGKDGLPCYAHNMLKNLLFGGKVKVNNELWMIESFAPENSSSCAYHFRYSFQVTQECEINVGC